LLSSDALPADHGVEPVTEQRDGTEPQGRQRCESMSHVTPLIDFLIHRLRRFRRWALFADDRKRCVFDPVKLVQKLLDGQ